MHQTEPYRETDVNKQYTKHFYSIFSRNTNLDFAMLSHILMRLDFRKENLKKEDSNWRGLGKTHYTTSSKTLYTHQRGKRKAKLEIVEIATL
jgi:hypothetical protein